MSKRAKAIAITGAILILISCVGLIYLDRTQFIHVYGYETTDAVYSSGLSIKVRLQPQNSVRDKIPEKVFGPPYSVVMVINCPQEIRQLRLKRLLVNSIDGDSEDCRIVVAGGAPKNSVTVVDATITAGKWGDHIQLIAVFEMTKGKSETEVRVEIPIKRSHNRLLRLPMI